MVPIVNVLNIDVIINFLIHYFIIYLLIKIYIIKIFKYDLVYYKFEYGHQIFYQIEISFDFELEVV